ncbi:MULTISPECIES: hypothetical protein [Rhizobium]|uniref:hypothetical protein n=1 Tax=Rhizobium TaxID=379 RepID=UPI001EF9A147|nr:MULTISPECIES: hypothetical protein [Rhizobium]MDF0658034.1 hypothetical protein [Rhizobium sp. BC49]ULJ77152.1 hypothetical protein MF410_13855 [Rhizobium sp. C104]
MNVQAEVDLPTQKQKWAWASAALLCVLTSPVFLVLKTLAFMMGLNSFLFFFGAFLVISVVGFSSCSGVGGLEWVYSGDRGHSWAFGRPQILLVLFVEKPI